MKTFTCRCCSKTLAISIACKDKNRKKGYINLCLSCASEKNKESYNRNKDKNRIKRKKKDKINKKRYYEKNKELVKQRRKEYYYANRERINRDRAAKGLEYNRKKRQTDPLYRIGCNLRRRMHMALFRGKYKRSQPFNQYIGCTVDELKAYLESKFTDGMTWDNYGKKGWEIDHIVPLCTASTVEELYKLSHYTNLQPLWATDNYRKGGRLIPPSP